jgi:hypothetical protein
MPIAGGDDKRAALDLDSPEPVDGAYGHTHLWEEGNFSIVTTQRSLYTSASLKHGGPQKVDSVADRPPS